MPDTGGTNQSSSSSQPVFGGSGVRIGGMCLNWRVVGALAAVGLGIWVVAPNLVAGAVPLLIVLACPLSMVLMMRGMSGGHKNRADERADAPAAPQQVVDSGRPRDLAALKAEHARLTAELEAFESDVDHARTEQDGSGNDSKNPTSTPVSDSRGTGGGIA